MEDNLIKHSFTENVPHEIFSRVHTNTSEVIINGE